MITKSFELRANVAYFVPAKSVKLCKETLMPVSAESEVPSFSFNHRLADDIMFFGLCHGAAGTKTVVISNEHETVFLWIKGTRKHTYRIKATTLSIDLALENLTKAYLTDDKLTDGTLGDIIGDVVREWLFTTSGLKFDWTLACKWRKEFVYFQVVKEHFNSTSISVAPFGKKAFHSDLKTHPLDAVRADDAPSSKIV